MPQPVFTASYRWYVATGGPHLASTDGTAPAAAPDVHRPSGMSERLEITVFEQGDGTWRFRIAADGRTFVTGEEVASRDIAERQVASVREHAAREESFVRAESPDGRFFFNLLGDNRHVLATSERFASAKKRDAAVEDLRRLVGTAPVGVG